MTPSIRAYIAEFIGTFTLVFFGTSVAVLQGVAGQGPAGWLGISFTFGFTLLVLVLTIGPVSGCHVNPAVTLAVALDKRMKWSDVPAYMIAQCFGAIAASAVLLALLKGYPKFDLAIHSLGANGNPEGLHMASLLGFEFVMTALFLFTILSVTRSDRAIPSSKSPAFAALAIGSFLFVAHLIGVPLGDSSLNPARSIGPALLQGGDALSILWIFIVGPFAGGIAGLVLYRLVHED